MASYYKQLDFNQWRSFLGKKVPSGTPIHPDLQNLYKKLVKIGDAIKNKASIDYYVPGTTVRSQGGYTYYHWIGIKPNKTKQVFYTLGISPGFTSKNKGKSYLHIKLDVKQGRNKKVKNYSVIEPLLPSEERWEWENGGPLSVMSLDDIVNAVLDYISQHEADYDNIEQQINPNQQMVENNNSAMKTSQTTMKKMPHPLNLILYGPPGTGKTYNTMFKALEIIEGKSKDELEKEKKEHDEKWDKDDADPKTERKGYDVMKDRYEEYVKKGQIVFTTFHQSMSYEDFIEGIKPNVDDDDIRYDVQDGIFKKLCASALNEYSDVDFDTCYKKFVSDLGTQTSRLRLKSIGGSEFYVDLNSKDNLNLYTTNQQNKNGVLTKEKIKQTYFEKENYWKGYMMGVVNYLKATYNLPTLKKIEKKENYVLIIDEINRGNVAQIFGELITLIEESKRLGASEAMTATLPYSQMPLGVPNNLYILGTMNTADRSVEALDTALRRRFSFEEMMPNLKLLEETEICGVKLSDLLSTINARIVALKDREHQIGHSYFMGSEKEANKEEWLKNVFKDKIIPLLQEYFYGDYKKIYYVLGPGFVAPKTEDVVFAVDMKDDFDFDISKERYEIKTEIDIGSSIKSLNVKTENNSDPGKNENSNEEEDGKGEAE